MAIRKIVALGVGLIIIAVGTIALMQNSKPDPIDETIKFSSDQIASLLGIKENDGLKIGEIESGRQGVKVKSILIKNTDGTEVDIQDIELQVKHTEKLSYAISLLRIGKADVLDWKTTQRVQVFGITVEQPGDGFLTKLEAAVSSVRSGGAIKTVDLSCARMGIERIDYAIRTKEATVTRISIEGLSLVGAKSDILDELNVTRATVGDAVSGAGLKVTKVDRHWADLLLAKFVMPKKIDPATAPKPTDSPAKVAQSKQLDSKRGQASSKPLVTPTKNTLKGNRILPFDNIDVDEMSISPNAFDDLKTTGVFKIVKLHLAIERRSDGKVIRLNGSVMVSVSPDILYDQLNAGRKKIDDFFHTMGGPKIEECLVLNIKISSTIDHIRKCEESVISVQTPGVAAITVSANTQRLLDLVGMYITLDDLPVAEDGDVTMKSIKLSWVDDGILSFILSNRYKDWDYVRKQFSQTIETWPHVSERTRLVSELSLFFNSPSAILFTGESSDFVPILGFFTPFHNGIACSKLTFTTK